MEELEKYFSKLRHNKKFHLGLGDVRLTIAMQEEIVEIAKRNAAEQIAEADLLPQGETRHIFSKYMDEQSSDDL